MWNCRHGGSVETRLAKAESDEHDGVVLAAAGLRHLGLAERVSEYLSVEEFVPPPGQGVPAAEMRADDYRKGEILAWVDHSTGRSAATPERAFLESLGRGCQLPVETQPLETIWEIPDVLWEKV